MSWWETSLIRTWTLLVDFPGLVRRGAQLIDVEAGSSRGLDDHALARLQAARRRRHPRRDIVRDDDRAMLVRVDQVAVADAPAGPIHRPAECTHMHRGGRRPDAAGQHLEAFGDVGQIAHRAVGDHALAAEAP